MQINLDFDTDLVTAYPTCREFVAYSHHHQGVPQKAIAADMDYSPSTLSRKLAQGPEDSQRFTLDDLESYMRVTGDTKPVLYLVEKYLTGDSEAELMRQIKVLDDKIKNLRGNG